jgi:hypothetical protein
VIGFGISGVELLNFATTALVSYGKVDVWIYGFGSLGILVRMLLHLARW